MFMDSTAGSVNGGHISSHQKRYHNDTLNPYFMHPNENPGNVLTTLLLNGTNYHSWCCSITVALRSKHKLHFINGVLPHPPDEDRGSIAWDRCNTMVMSWLNNSFEPEYLRVLYGLILHQRLGKSSKIDFIKVMSFESLIFKKKCIH